MKKSINNLSTTISISEMNKTYTVEEFKNIARIGFNYTLPEYTLQIINKVAHLVGSPDYIKTPIFKKKLYDQKNNLDDHQHKYNKNNYQNHKNNDIENKRQRKRKNNKEVSDFEWHSMRNFESTVIKKNEEGIQKEINKIRILLNKLSNDNYDDILFEINHKLRNIIEENDDVTEHDLYEVGAVIFEIGTQNSFYASLYAKLFKELMKSYDVMKKVFDFNYLKFIEIFSNIEYVSPDEDYEKYCEINAQNIKRRAVASFMSNLVNEEVVSVKDIYDNINTFIDMFNTNIETPDKGFICEEVMEILHTILTTCFIKIYEENNKQAIKLFNIMYNISEYNIKSYVSLTNKSLFKCMDIVEYMEKNQ